MSFRSWTHRYYTSHVCPKSSSPAEPKQYVNKRCIPIRDSVTKWCPQLSVQSSVHVRNTRILPRHSGMQNDSQIKKNKALQAVCSCHKRDWIMVSHSLINCSIHQHLSHMDTSPTYCLSSCQMYGCCFTHNKKQICTAAEMSINKGMLQMKDLLHKGIFSWKIQDQRVPFSSCISGARQGSNHRKPMWTSFVKRIVFSRVLQSNQIASHFFITFNSKIILSKSS